MSKYWPKPASVAQEHISDLIGVFCGLSVNAPPQLRVNKVEFKTQRNTSIE